MMTNIKIDLTDDQRRTLQQQLTGKVRLITRAELSDFVSGIIEGACTIEEVVADPPHEFFEPNPKLTEIPGKWANKYANRTEAWKAGWLRGWNAVGARLK